MPTSKPASEPASSSSLKLAGEVQQFAAQLMGTLKGFLGHDVVIVVNVGAESQTGTRHFTVRQDNPEGIPLYIDTRLVFRLLVDYRCEWNTSREYFAIAKSSFQVLFNDRSEPFLHFDYVREAGTSIPVSHVNVHAHRDEAIFAMMLATKKRGKRRSKKTEGGAVPALADLHIPTGGHRFRPALEDVLEMLWQEYGIDVDETNALTSLKSGRMTYRTTQLRTAVTDDPEAAAEVLRMLQYEVKSPTPAPSPREDRLSRY